jgi:tetratricopeptide (TPR) repeat protein
LEAGEFESAEKLLNQARDRDLEAAKQIQEIARKRLLSAATSAAANGDLKNTQLAYVEAATYYREAANILPSDADELRAGYLNYAGIALYHAGTYGDAESLYQRALKMREQVLGPQHPDVAQSLNNLAALYYAQGKYTEAEPLLQRALQIWEHALAARGVSGRR